MKFIKVLNNLKQEALLEHKSNIKEVIEAGLVSHERIFPILNKLDKLWNANPSLQFCELVKLLNTEQYKNDLEFTKRLDELIDGNSTTK